VKVEALGGTYSDNIYIPSGHSAKVKSQPTVSTTISGSLSILFFQTQKNNDVIFLVAIAVVVLVVVGLVFVIITRKKQLTLPFLFL
jgi:hypothetical protein